MLGKVTQNAMGIDRRTNKIRHCDKGILRSGRNIMRCCLILEGKIMFRFRRSCSIDCHWLLSFIAVCYIMIITESTSKLLKKIVEMTCCHIKIKRNLMLARHY